MKPVELRAMKPAVFDEAPTLASALPDDRQERLEVLLRRRRIEAWRRDTAAEAKTAARALRSGKLAPLPVEDGIAGLRAGLLRETN